MGRLRGTALSFLTSDTIGREPWFDFPSQHFYLLVKPTSPPVSSFTEILSLNLIRFLGFHIWSAFSRDDIYCKSLDAFKLNTFTPSRGQWGVSSQIVY